MDDKSDNLLLEPSRGVCGDIADFRTDTAAVKGRFGTPEQRYPSWSRPVDRFGGPAEPGKRRMDLVEAP